jgi:hypothetical protein
MGQERHAMSMTTVHLLVNGERKMVTADPMRKALFGGQRPSQDV